MTAVDRSRNGYSQDGFHGEHGTRWSSNSSNTPMTVPRENISSESRNSDVETDVWSQTGQWPPNNPEFMGSNTSNSADWTSRHVPAVDYSPQRQWNEDKSINEVNARPPYNYQHDSVQEKKFSSIF